MQQTDELLLTHAVVAQLRSCGHFLYYRMGGRTGRRRILTILSEHPGILQKELQDILKIQSGSLSEVVIKLETDGFVKKVRSKTDGRQWAVCLTKKGQEEAKRLKLEYDQQIAEMMACFSKEQLISLNELLSTLTAHWNEIDMGKGQLNIEKENE